MRGTTHASPDDIDITSIWGTLRRSGKPLLLASILAGVATFAVLSMMAPRYMSEAQLTIMAKSARNSTPGLKNDGAPPDAVNVLVDPAAVNTHVNALKSPDIANRVAQSLKLNTIREFNSAVGSSGMLDTVMRIAGLAGPRPGESEQDRILNAYYKRLEVYAAKESRFIGVRFSATDPTLAAEVANKIAEEYRETLDQHTVDDNTELRVNLEQKVKTLQQDAARALENAEDFRRKSNIFEGGSQKIELRKQQLADLTTELTKAKSVRSEAEARARAAREMLKTGSADALPDAQKSPLIQSLVQQRVRLEREISELSATLLPGHPRMRQLNADLTGLKKQLVGEISKLVDSLEKEAKVSAIRVDGVTRSLDEIKSEISEKSGDEVQLRQLEDVAKSKRTELEHLMKELEAIKSGPGVKVANVEVRVISPARASSVPVFPKKGPYTALVALATLLFGTAWVVTRALLVGARSNSGAHPLRRASDHQLAPNAAAPITVNDPIFNHSPDAVARVAPDQRIDMGGTAEIATVAKLARHIRAIAPDKGGFRTLMCGASNNIDASFEALALAQELVRDGLQTIVIDWSTNEDGFSRRIGLPSQPGFNDLARGDASFEDVIRSLPDGRVHIVPCGSSASARSAGGMLDSQKLNLLLDALDEAYDQIIVVSKLTDARALFEAIQGRFDAGVSVADAMRNTSVVQDPPGTFLGFEVTDINLIRLNRSEDKPQGAHLMTRRGLPADATSPAM
ncbi:MAG: lipopolysaccharide biosynthesis protein [Hyphomicrobiaceae bacterium]|nr:lipopolysaccharide biosynthesis protein [Hyphomicrobiaceae bacterium]